MVVFLVIVLLAHAPGTSAWAQNDYSATGGERRTAGMISRK